MEVSHDPEKHVFSADTPTGTASLTYAERDGGTMELLHTVVPDADQGKGIGSELVEQVIRIARQTDKRVIPTCEFVRSWLDDHPEHRDVVDR
jgi:uncharacterized protein